MNKNAQNIYPIRDITGQVFARLTVVSFHSKGGGHTKWNCICECGKPVIATESKMKRGHTKSCGCLRDEKIAALMRTHGQFRHPLYPTWWQMRWRCSSPKDSKYMDYGGRGITVCDRWINSFDAFVSDMGERPTPQHSVERIDNDKGYSPDNCRWATKKEQNRNMRSNHWLIGNGKKMILLDWSKELNVNESVISKNPLRFGLTSLKYE